MSDRFPWFPFYVADWRLSDTVRGMTYEQRGVYVELLTIAWGDGTVMPSLRDDPVWLASVTGLGRRWNKIGAPVLEMCFTIEDERYVNARLSHVWAVQRAKYDVKSEAGRLGGIAKAKRLANGKHSQDSASGFAGQTQMSDRTKSSSGPQRLGALADGAVAAAVRRP